MRASHACGALALLLAAACSLAGARLQRGSAFVGYAEKALRAPPSAEAARALTLRAEQRYGCVGAGAKDSVEHCVSWAADGECGKNKQYMCVNCASACARDCTGGCVAPHQRLAARLCFPDAGGASQCRYVAMDFSVGGQAVGRVVLGLFDAVVPKTSENFVQLLPRYAGTTLHRIIPEFMSQGGAASGQSIYGSRWDDENFDLKYSEPFLLGMANAGPNTNGAQWFLTTVRTPHLDGKHVVFGGVLAGFDTALRINEAGTKSGKPKEEVKIEAAMVVSAAEARALLEAEVRRLAVIGDEPGEGDLEL